MITMNFTYAPTQAEDLAYCDDCGCYTNRIGHRQSMKGQYCLDCAKLEKCGACGEVFQLVEFDEERKMWLCRFCTEHFDDGYEDQVEAKRVEATKTKAA